VTGYLLDTNVVSEARKGQRINANVLVWLKSTDETDLFLSVLVIGEIRNGIERARATDPAKARVLEQWCIGLERQYGDRLLPVTSTIAEKWGRLSAVRPLPVVDGLLAATAIVHDLTLATRDAMAVADLGVRLLNPFLAS
jgi:predicted nucleic acid-binding protein